MNVKTQIGRALGAVGFLIAAGFASAEVVVVVNSASAVQQASASEIQQVYLGKRNDIGGASLTPVDVSEGSEIRTIFYDKVIDKDPAQLNAYWSRLIFTGKGIPPKQYFDEAEVVEVILENEDSIGYIDAAGVTEGLRVIYTVK
ncbi:MAG: phosphate ABC transporter substrate-binding protein [Ketobacter sp.]